MDNYAAILDRAAKQGATQTDLWVTTSTETSVQVRNQQSEGQQQQTRQDITLRICCGQRQAVLTSNDASGLDTLVDEAVSLAKLLPEDPHLTQIKPTASVPEAKAEAALPSVEALNTSALDFEKAALAVSGVSNTEGARAFATHKTARLISSQGFDGCYNSVSMGLYGSVLATGENGSMERDDAYAYVTDWQDLPDPTSLGQEAGEKAVKRCNPKPLKTGSYPILFSSDAARGLLRSLLPAFNGVQVAEGRSFLASLFAQTVGNASLSIIDTPLLDKGLRNLPFDGEAQAPAVQHLIKDGVVSAWLLDAATAKRLDTQTTARAQWHHGQAPQPGATNVQVVPGQHSVADLLKDHPGCFMVTETMGMGVNLLTGQYSQGAAGFWLEGGEAAYPVSGVTIAGELQTMLATVQPANDFAYKTGIDSPSLLIPQLQVAGA